MLQKRFSSSPSPSSHLFSVPVSNFFIAVVNWLNKSSVLISVARKFEFHFLSELLLKARHFKQRSSPKETITKITFSESCRFGFRRRSWFWSQQGFLGSSKHLYQLLSWGLRCKSSFWTRICENFPSERLMVFSILRLRFNCFRMLFTGSHRLVYQMFSWVRRCKISFLDANLRNKNMYKKYFLIFSNRGWLAFKCGFCLWTFFEIFQWDFSSSSKG